MEHAVLDKWSFGLVFALIVFVGSCGDVVSSYYKTYKDAAADQVFARGWLPEVIPPSAFDIRVSNDIDLNTSHGDFSYLPGDHQQFISKLMPLDPSRKSPFSGYDREIEKGRAQGYALYELVDGGSIWVFFVHNAKRHVRYDFWLISRPGRTT